MAVHCTHRIVDSAVECLEEQSSTYWVEDKSNSADNLACVVIRMDRDMRDGRDVSVVSGMP